MKLNMQNLPICNPPHYIEGDTQKKKKKLFAVIFIRPTGRNINIKSCIQATLGVCDLGLLIVYQESKAIMDVVNTMSTCQFQESKRYLKVKEVPKGPRVT